MKYLKTFENYSISEETPEDVKKLQDPNSVEFKALVTNLAKEKGVDAQQAVVQAIETAKDSSTEKANEEIVPMAILAVPVLVVAAAGLVGLLAANFNAKKGLKLYIKQQAEIKVHNMVKENPELTNNVEELVSKAYDEMMADKEFIAKLKSEKYNQFVSMGSVKAGRGPY
jgi:hypothetical protein